MTAGEGFGLHPEAARDSSEIWEFIAVDNPHAAGRIREMLFNAISSLVASPNQGVFRPELSSRLLRFKLVANYYIAYAHEEQPLWVVAVIHGRRSPRVISALLRGREIT